MSKRRPDQPDVSKMKFMFFEIEGNDETLQEGFRAINTALRGMAGRHDGGDHAKALQAIEPLPVGPELSKEDLSEAEEAGERPSRSRNSKQRILRSPDVLDLDLLSGDVPLKAFLDRCNTEDTTKKYLLIAYWLKQYRNIQEVSMDHIHTGFRHMGWQTPKDAAYPLRIMKSQNQWFHKGEQKGYYKINHIGENQVVKLLEK
jgi:hypothetical protein